MTCGPQKKKSHPVAPQPTRGTGARRPPPCVPHHPPPPASGMARRPHSSRTQESERYDRNDTLYKSLRCVSRVLEDTGHRTVHAVCPRDGGLTNDPDTVLQAALDRFQAQHGDALLELDPHTRSTIREHVPKVFNREQWRAIQNNHFSIPELQSALDRLKKEVVSGLD